MATQSQTSKDKEQPGQGSQDPANRQMEDIPVVSANQEEEIPVLTGEDIQHLTGRPQQGDSQPSDDETGTGQENAPQGSARLRKRRRWYVDWIVWLWKKLWSFWK